MADIAYAFANFPLFEGRRPILASGEAQCRATKIGPSLAGQPSLVKWRVISASFVTSNPNGRKTELTQSEALRQDFERWLRGTHGRHIERLLRAANPRHQGDEEK